MTKIEIMDNLYDLSQCIIEIASDLEKDKMDIDDVPKCFMDIIADDVRLLDCRYTLYIEDEKKEKKESLKAIQESEVE
jgi:hypothetical protein